MQLHLCLLSGFDSHSWKMQVKCVQKKYFTYLIDKIVSFKINFSKTFVIQFYFFIIIFIFITSIFQPCIPSGRFSKWAFLLLYYKNVQIWYFHGQHKANSLGTNETSFMSHEQSSYTLSQHKENVHIFNIINVQLAKQRKCENIKKWGCRAIVRTLPNIYNEIFLWKYNS